MIADRTFPEKLFLGGLFQDSLFLAGTFHGDWILISGSDFDNL